MPSTPVPTQYPSPVPTIVPSLQPTPVPSLVPTPLPTLVPTLNPSPVPTLAPTPLPSPVPTLQPTPVPTLMPTPAPTPFPTHAPTPRPTRPPTLSPSPVPTAAPVIAPTGTPSIPPTHQPSLTEPPSISVKPSTSPTMTTVPTLPPSPLPSPRPTVVPTPTPSAPPEILVSLDLVRVAEADNALADGGGGVSVAVRLANRPTSSVYVAVRSLFGQSDVRLNGLPKSDDDGYRAFVDDDGVGFLLLGPFDFYNWDVPQVFTVSAIDDDKAEWSRGGTGGLDRAAWFEGQGGDDVLALVGVSNYDGRYNGLAASRNVTVLVEDDDDVGIELVYPFSPAVSQHAYAVGPAVLAADCTEGSASASHGHGESYGVRLRSQPFGEVVVHVHVNYSAHAWILADRDGAFTVSSEGMDPLAPAEHTLTFTRANWRNAQRVSVLVHSDRIARPDKSFTVTLTHNASSEDIRTHLGDLMFVGDPAYGAITTTSEPRFALTVHDDDAAGLFVSATKLTLGCDYDGNPLFGDHYAIALTSEPTAPVEVHLSVRRPDDPHRVVKFPETLLGTRTYYFTTANWFTPQAVAVTATAKKHVAKRTDVIFHLPTSTDAVYGSAATGVASLNGGEGPRLTVNVGVSRDSTPPPRLHTTEFGPAGATALILFDRSTNQALLRGRFACGRLLFGEAVAAFGATGYCSWASAALLKVTLGPDATVKPGAFFGVKNKALMSDVPNATLFTTNATGYLTAPAEAVAMVVALSAPSSIGGCDRLLVDARLTSGSGGRTLAVIWNVTFHNLPENVSVANLTHAVNEASRTNALFVTAPPADVPFVGMTFSVRARNWLGNEDSASVEVYKHHLDSPTVRIAGYGSTAALFLSDAFKLTAVATLPACVPGSTALAFAWSEPSGHLSSAQVASLATASPRSISVRGGTMVAGRTYRFAVTCIVAGNPAANATATLSVYAKPSDLFASVAGGSSRLASRMEALPLDGSASFDPDLPLTTTHLTFAWACYSYALGGACVHADTGATLSLAPAAVTELAAFTLSAGLYRLTHTVLCAGDGRNASVAVELELAATEVPKVSIKALTMKKVNPNAGSFLPLVGSVTADTALGTVAYEWTKAFGDDPTADSGFESVFAASRLRLATVLELGALTEGSTYRFRLTAVASGGGAAATGFAEVSVVVNSPPSSGQFLAAPMAGVALVTDFSLSCVSWVDDASDLPLLYGFRAAPGTEVARSLTTHSEERLLVALSTTPSFVTVLPEGQARSRNVSLVAYVTDRFMGRTRSTLVVSVGSLADNFASQFALHRRLSSSGDNADDGGGGDDGVKSGFGDFVLNLTNTLVGDATLVGNSEGAVSMIAAVASVANSPSGAAAMTTEKTKELVGTLVGNVVESSGTIEASAESIELLMGSLGAVANGQPGRLDAAASTSMLSLSLGMLATAANPSARLSVSDSAALAACRTFATLVGSDDLFGPASVNATNNSVALKGGTSDLARGRLVGRYSGMAAATTACAGMLVSASKIDAADTDGAPIAAGNSSFLMPGNFSAMVNLSEGDSVETSASVLDTNPHRGASKRAVNAAVSSLTLLVTRAGGGASSELPVRNLSSPISIRIPVLSAGAATQADIPIGANESWGVNVSCSGQLPLQSVYHECPGGAAAINYTCLEGAPYEAELLCNGEMLHTCVYWDEALGAWSGEGCMLAGLVRTASDGGFLICNCTHLTDFSSQLDQTLDLAADVVTSVASLSVSDILKNMLVLVVLLTVWGAMVVACIYSRYLDGLDKKKVVPFGQLPEAQMDAALLRARLSERRRGSSEEAARDGDDTDDSNAGTGVLGHGSNAVYEDMADFFAKGDGTDYGQHPDTLTPKALARRLQLKTLQFSVVAEQAKATLAMKQHKEKKETKKWRRGRRRVAPEAVLSNEQLLEVMPLLSRSKHSADPPCL